MLRHVLKSIPWRALSVAAFLSSSIWAQDAQDAPGRGVARISLIQGDVSVKRGDSGDWVAAAPNAPLVVEDRLLTGNGSRSEVQLDYANFVRLSSNAELRLAELEYNRYILQVAAGTVTYRVLRNSEAEVEVSTPSVAVRPSKKGIYRITVLPDNTTEITVRSGEVEILTPNGSERLKSGRTMLVRGTAADPEFQYTSAIPRDDWDNWSESRDRDLERSGSYRYVSSSIYGAEDLDNNGEWVYDAPYGHVWVPRVAVGWAPYRYGRWAWIDWYGWSWVSYDPWGWAPYHYGRWYMGSRGWCWYPGVIRSRHYWSPGLVAWVGFGGGGVGVGIGGGWGRVGWIPLAPHEPYHPGYGWNNYRGYRQSGRGNNNVTVVNNVNITNVYRNARVNNGITAVNAGDFSNGRVNNVVRLNDGDLQRANLVRGQLPVTPDRAALRLSDREVSAAPRGATTNERFYSRRTPASVERVSFDDQRKGVEELSRRTFGERAAGGAVPGATTERTGRTAESNAGPANSGWRRAAEPKQDAGAATTNTPANSSGNEQRGRRSTESGATPGSDKNTNNSGWRRFGEPRDAGANRQPADTSSTPNSAVTPDSSRSRRSVDSGSGTTPNSGVTPSPGTSSDRGGWRRFGDPGSSGGAGSTPPNSGASERRSRTESTPSSPAQSNDGMRRSGGSSSGSDQRAREAPRSAPSESPRRTDTPRAEPQRQSTPPSSDSKGESSPRRGRNDMSSSEPLRLNPPIVRERSSRPENFSSAADSGFGRSSRLEGRSSGGFGSGGSRTMQSAPRSSGGGFSGGGRSSGNGGGSTGGGRSSSGGGGSRSGGRNR